MQTVRIRRRWLDLVHSMSIQRTQCQVSVPRHMRKKAPLRRIISAARPGIRDLLRLVFFFHSIELAAMMACSALFATR